MGDRVGHHRRLRRPAAIDRRLPDTCTRRDIVHAHLVIAAVSELFEHCAEDGRVQRSIEAGRIARPLAPWSRGGITHHSEQYSSVTLGPSTSHPFRTSSARVRGTHDGDQQRRHRAHTPFRANRELGSRLGHDSGRRRGRRVPLHAGPRHRGMQRSAVSPPRPRRAGLHAYPIRSARRRGCCGRPVVLHGTKQRRDSSSRWWRGCC